MSYLARDVLLQCPELLLTELTLGLELLHFLLQTSFSTQTNILNDQNIHRYCLLYANTKRLSV